MDETTRPPPAAWVPSWVAAARRRGAATGDDLIGGAVWEQLLDSLRRVGEVVRSDRVPEAEAAAGFRHLLVLLALGMDEALRPADASEPQLRPGNVDAVLKWGMDCPDAAYFGAPVRGDATYRIHASRGTVRYLGFQLMAGMETLANVVADDLEIGPDGTFEIVLSPDERPGNWMPLPESATALIVRQFFYDWDDEEPARLAIERLIGASDLRTQADDASAVARRIVALGEFVEASLGFWLDMDEGLRVQALNSFREPSARTDIGGAAENVTVWGSWDLGDDEALVIEVEPPRALYWSVALGNMFWESLDYANHQSSLNGHQAVLDEDGVFRAVVAHRESGVANWLDTTGHRRGPMIFRWVRADSAPVPEARVVRFDELDSVLPHAARVSASQRRAVIARRRAAVRRRFCR